MFQINQDNKVSCIKYKKGVVSPSNDIWIFNIIIILIMILEGSGQDTEQYNKSQWEDIKKTVIKHYIQPEKLNIVSDQQLIQRQSDLMQEIKERIHRSRFKQSFGSMEVLPIDSSISNISSAYNYGDEESLIKSKFTEEFESSLVNSALKEVRANCSEQTYETVRNYVLNNKQKQCENLIKAYQKKTSEQSELQLAIIYKQNEIARLKEELAPFLQKVDNLEEEKKKWKKKNDQITEKEKRIHKTEMALIFKEKMYQEVKKRSQRLKEFTDSLHTKTQNILKELNNTWSNIMREMQKSDSSGCCTSPDPKGCWKKQVMKKCREKLLEERNLLKEEQKQLQKQYEVMESVSEQFKKLVSDSQQGMNPNNGLSNGGSSAINLGSEQKTTKMNVFSVIQPDTKRA